MNTVIRESSDTRKISRLPVGNRKAFWSGEAGLVVTPNSVRLPPEPPRDDRARKDFSRPRYLNNSTIYLAWFPRTPLLRGEIFGRLDATPQFLYSKVVKLPYAMGRAGDLQYALDDKFQNSWFQLEITLERVIQFLLESHPNKHHFLDLDPPAFPSTFGYRHAHRSPDIVVRCAMRAQHAFTMLGALLSFVLSLWVNLDDHIVFEPAFTAILKKSKFGLTRAWLSLLNESYVCSLSFGFRAGGIFNPYEFGWGRFLRHFVGVGIPLWFVWGPPKTIELYMPQILDPDVRRYLYPPEEVIELAKAKLRHGEVPLPYEPPTVLYSHYENDYLSSEGPRSDDGPVQTDFSAGSADDDTPVLPAVEYGTVQSGSLQRHGEDWRDFFERMRSEGQQNMKRETPAQKQSREAREKVAASGVYTKGSTVFIWRQEQGFYRRERLTAGEVEVHWDDYSPHQRVYTSHLKQWDLVDMLPEYPEGVERPSEPPRPQFDEDFDDDNDDIFPERAHRHPRLEQALAAATTEAEDVPPLAIAEVVDASLDEGEIVDVQPAPPKFEDFLQFLRLRFGYDFSVRHSVNLALHSQNRDFVVKKASDVCNRLGHAKFHAPPEYEALVVDFYNTLANDTLPNSILPSYWDMNPNGNFVNIFRRGFMFRTLLDVDSRRLFIIQILYANANDWMVAVSHASIVLFIFRNASRWNSLEALVKLLLEEGIPFSMPKRIKASAVQKRTRVRMVSRGLGGRERGWKPTRMDLEEYEMRAKEVFRSPVGRGLRMMGGIMWRLASGRVSDEEVLLGPRNLDHVIAEFNDGMVLAEDNIPANSLEIVAGIYYVEESTVATTAGQFSWWPKAIRWETCGYQVWQWTPDAETWFQNHRNELASAKFDVTPQKAWKVKLRRYYTKTRQAIDFGEYRANRFIREQMDRLHGDSSERPAKRHRQ